jgi:hypothetical protein
LGLPLAYFGGGKGLRAEPNGKTEEEGEFMHGSKIVETSRRWAG